MTTPTKLPETIQASIHQDALSRVPSFFNATTIQILNELLQNSRRAGAKRVDITTIPGYITIADDGQGIPDPTTLLAFGQTGWDRRTTRSEHPAGMGLYTLARRKEVQVQSRCPGGAAWQVHLTPDHFTGRIPAPVETMEEGETTPGTRITFNNESPAEQNIRTAAQYYPLPVYHNGDRVENHDFLNGAFYSEAWRGVRIGVFKNREKMRIGVFKDREVGMNFHGVLVQNLRLPLTRDIKEDSWTVKTDVLDCPNLELTLPARREVVETPFMEELRTACQRAIYRAMAADPEPADVPRKNQDEARKMGVTLPDARSLLTPWEAGRADHIWCWNHSKGQRVLVDESALVIDVHLEPGDQQTLSRAASRNQAHHRLMESNRNLEGYRWYDSLQHIREVEIAISQDGETWNLEEMRDEDKEPKSQRPDSITFKLRGGRHYDPFELSLPSDVAFQYAEEYEGESTPLVTKDSNVNVEELTEIMVNSFFLPHDALEADSYDTQQENYREDSEKNAMELLLDETEARGRQLEKAVRDHVIQEIPPGSSVTIRVNREDRTAQVSIEQE